MLRASLAFFLLGILALALGINDVGGVSLELGRLLLFVFLGLALVSYLAGLVTGRNVRTPRFLILGVLSFWGLSGATPLHHLAQADESMETQAKNAGEDAKKESSKTVRKAKKAGRKSVGTDSAAKDLQDKAGDAKDDTSAEANKAKNKMESQ